MSKKFTNLYYELEKRGLSKEAFAAAVFTSTRSVENWFNKNSIPSTQTKIKISMVLEMGMPDVDNLFKFSSKK